MTGRGAGEAKWPSGLPPVLRLEGRNSASLPHRLATEDVRFTEQFVAFFVERLTAPGDVVLDPFAGFGTTPVVAERMGREGWGIEIDPERVTCIRDHVAARDHIIWADARSLATLRIPPIALVVTSPPFSAPGDPCDALGGYRGRNPGYAAYLAGLRDVSRQVRALLAPGGWIVIESADLSRSGEVTPLPRDIADAVGEVLPFVGEIDVEWAPPLRGDYDRSVCLLFSAGTHRQTRRGYRRTRRRPGEERAPVEHGPPS